MNQCIFQKSRFYKKAVAIPSKILQPIGYSFLIRNKNTNMQLVRTGQLVRKYITDRQVYKFIPGKKSLPQKLQQFFQITELQRKSHYLSSPIADFLQKQISAEILNALIGQFMPNTNEQYGTVQLAQLISNPGIDSIYHVEDFGLSKFFFVYQGNYIGKLDYLYEFYNRRIIEYPIEGIHIKRGYKNEIENQKPYITEYQEVNVQNKQDIIKQIDSINQQNMKKDLYYNGVHFYYGDCIFEGDKRLNILDRQIQHNKLLQYYVLMITGILGQGQSAVIKLNGCFRQKTCEYIFLLKLAFNGKFTLVKPYGTNPYNLQCYLICEYYNSYNGKKVHQYILNNFQLLKNYGEDKLLLNSKKIFRQGIFECFKVFNDVMIKNLQSIIKQFKNNPAIQYYPNKNKLLQKIPTKFCMYNELINTIDEILPRQESFVQDQKKKKKEQNNNKIIQKQGNTQLLDIFTSSFFGQKEKKKEDKNEKIKKEQKQKNDESLQNFLNQMNKTKKNNEKKKKTQKNHDL